MSAGYGGQESQGLEESKRVPGTLYLGLPSCFTLASLRGGLHRLGPLPQQTEEAVPGLRALFPFDFQTREGGLSITAMWPGLHFEKSSSSMCPPPGQSLQPGEGEAL